MRVLTCLPTAGARGGVWDLTLLHSGARVEVAPEVEEALDLSKLYDFDLVVCETVDLVASMRRAKVMTPAVVLLWDHTIANLLECFASGADDVQAQTLPREELVARARAIVRRARGQGCSTIEAHGIVLDLDKKEVRTVEGKTVHLTGKEYGMLELLMLRMGSALTKEAFLDHLYGGMDEPELKIVYVFVCKLRKKLSDANGGVQPIDTVWGCGYVIPREEKSDEAA